MAGNWQHGLCGCFDNCGLCIKSFLCPCYVFGKNAEAVGNSCCLCGLCFLIPGVDLLAATVLRGKIRDHKGISGSCPGDFCAWIFCSLCALVQEANEVQSGRGQAMARE